MTKKKIGATKKKLVKKPNIPKLPQPKIHPVIILFIIALAMAMLIPNIKDTQLYKDDNVGLNVLEQKYIAGEYKSIEIDENKAIATLSGAMIEENGLEKTPRHIAILPSNDSLKDLGLKNPDVQTEITIKDNTSKKFWSGILPTLLAFLLF